MGGMGGKGRKGGKGGIGDTTEIGNIPGAPSYTFFTSYAGCNKIIVRCTLYTKNGIFYFCNRSNRLIYMYVR